MEQYIKEKLWVSTTHIPGSCYEEANAQSETSPRCYRAEA